MGLGAIQKELSHFGDSTGDWVKEREETVPSQSMAPRPRNNKGTNVPSTASEPIGENEVASRQRNEGPLVEQKVILRQRRAGQELDPVECRKICSKRSAFSKRVGPKKLGTTSPLWSTRTEPNQREG